LRFEPRPAWSGLYAVNPLKRVPYGSTSIHVQLLVQGNNEDMERGAITTTCIVLYLS
jgi:hypothetical protein